MAIIQYKVLVGATYATMTNELANVQSVTLNIGRQHQLNQYSANTGSVVIRVPGLYFAPSPFFVTGTWISISVRQAGGTYYELFVGKINNVTLNYGVKYQSSVGPADYATLSLEGSFAQWGRVQGKSYAMPAGTWDDQVGDAFTETGLSAPVFAGGSTNLAATTVSGSWGDWLSKSLLTVNGRMIDWGDYIGLYDQYFRRGFNEYGGFSDTTNDATNHTYTNINFSSLADNYYTQIRVAPEGLAAQTVQTGSAPYRTYEVNTLNATTSDALAYANRLLTTYSTTNLKLESLTCHLPSQIGGIPAYGANLVSEVVSVIFRGTTYYGIIEGMTWSGTPDNAFATFYLSAGTSGLTYNSTIQYDQFGALYDGY